MQQKSVCAQSTENNPDINSKCIKNIIPKSLSVSTPGYGRQYLMFLFLSMIDNI